MKLNVNEWNVSHEKRVLKRLQFTGFIDYRSGEGNRRSTAGHIDCICVVFLAGYIYFKFVNFTIKIIQYWLANLSSIHAPKKYSFHTFV